MYNNESGNGKEEDILQESSCINFSSVQRYGQPTAVTVPVEQSYDRLQSSREAV